MKLDNLAEEEIKEVFSKILYKIEINKDVVEKSLKYCPIYKSGLNYCIEFYNGFEHKLCCINDRKVYVSSESLEGNKYLTTYLKSVLQEIAEQKFSLEA